MRNGAIAIVLSLLCAASGAAPATACDDRLSDAIKKQAREQMRAAERQERLMKERNEILARHRR